MQILHGNYHLHSILQLKRTILDNKTLKFLKSCETKLKFKTKEETGFIKKLVIILVYPVTHNFSRIVASNININF